MQKIDEFTLGYIEAIFFTEEERFIEDGYNNGKHFSEDFAPGTMEKIIEDCRVFQARHSYMFGKASPSQAGHDFWLTRNGHGAGFWDRPELYGEENARALSAVCGWQSTFFKEQEAYIGDDGRIYF